MGEYYAIKRGRQIGVCDTEEERDRRIKDFWGCLCQTFSTEQEAWEYLGGNRPRMLAKLEMEQTEFLSTHVNVFVVYVDGSFRERLKDVYGFSFLLIKNGKIVYRHKEYRQNKEAVKGLSGSEAAELRSAMTAVQYLCYKQKGGYKSRIVIHHDNMQIKQLYTGEIEARKELEKQYVRYMKDKAKRFKLSIDFVKVKAHNGNLYNEEADRLAKESLEDYQTGKKQRQRAKGSAEEREFPRLESLVAYIITHRAWIAYSYLETKEIARLISYHQAGTPLSETQLEILQRCQAHIQERAREQKMRHIPEREVQMRIENQFRRGKQYLRERDRNFLFSILIQIKRGKVLSELQQMWVQRILDRLEGERWENST